MAHSVLWRIPTLIIVLSILGTSVWISFDHHYLDWHPGHEHLFMTLGHTHDYGSMDLSDAYPHHGAKKLDGTEEERQTYTGSFLDSDAGTGIGVLSIDVFDKELLSWMKYSSNQSVSESPQPFPSGIQPEVPTPPPIT